MKIKTMNTNNSQITGKAQMSKSLHTVLTTKIASLNKFMNNSKWYKLFEVLEDNDVLNIEIKFLLRSERETVWGKYVSLYKEGIECFQGVFSYKEIEWIKILEKTENDVMKTTIDEIEKIINSIGQFNYEKEIDGIIIYGYK